MNEHAVSVSIRILDKEYRISCAPEERDGLMESARVLNARMKEVRDGGKVLGIERIAVMTALNVIHECLQHQQGQEEHALHLDRGVRQLVEKIDATLGRRDCEETID